jgi:hypothetical protein
MKLGKRCRINRSFGKENVFQRRKYVLEINLKTGKVIPGLQLIKNYGMKTYGGGVEIQLHHS